MDGHATVAEVAAERRSSAEAMPLEACDADRFRSRAEPPGEPDIPRGGPGAPMGQTRPGRSRAAAAPPPDTVVVASLRHAAALEEKARAREAALRAEHAAEVAWLTGALRDQREAHAAELERLRAEHAAGLRRLVETHRRARDAARTGAERRPGPGGESDAGPQARSRARPSGIRREWLARLKGRF